MILSIDIGIHNLGYALLDDDVVWFDVYDVDNKMKPTERRTNIVLSRTKYLHEFVKDIFENNIITKVIIERQVPTNTIAMEIMYLLTGIVYTYCSDIVIFDPKLKFTTLGFSYNTHNKAHKKLSIEIVQKYLENKNKILLDKLLTYDKKDDISDAILMGLIELFRDDKQELVSIRKYHTSL